MSYVLSTKDLSKFALYQDQVQLVKSITNYSIKIGKSPSPPYRFIFWGDFIPFLLLRNAVRDLNPTHVLVEDINHRNLIPTLERHPDSLTWIYANSFKSDAFKLLPKDPLIFFVFCKTLKNDYHKLVGVKDWCKNALPLSSFKQSFHS